MEFLRQFFTDPTMQKAVSLIGTVLAAILASIWAVFKYFHSKGNNGLSQAKRQVSGASSKVHAEGGSISAGENVSISASGCSVAVGGDLTQSDIDIICGIPPAVFEKLIDRYERVISDKDDILGLLREKLRLNERQIEAAFEAAGREGVAPERMGEALLDIARKYKSLREELQDTSGDNAEIKQKKALAKDALENGELDRADAIFDEIIAIEDAAIDQRALEAAETRARKAELAILRLRYRDAADAYGAAAKRLPATCPTQKIEYRSLQANSLLNDGYEFGRNESLQRAIEVYQQLISEIVRDENPDAWATTQNNLGVALKVLGEREPGANRLEGAVSAHRAALEERPRDLVPLDWAKTHSNLGNALLELGRRESGTARLEEAAATYRAALEELPRNRVAFDWATTQINLGAALQEIGTRESGTDRLKEAVAALRAALEELDQDRVPLVWAMTQNNLGNALGELGTREEGTARLKEAVAAFKAALKERTRERVPLSWAATQNNLSIALCVLGKREPSTTLLQEAADACRAALEEYTQNRSPLDWAMTQYNLGNALLELGKQTSDLGKLREARLAFEQSREVFGDRYQDLFEEAFTKVDNSIDSISE